MPRRTRRLWLEIKYKVPVGISRDTVISVLKKSVENKTYDLPIGWNAIIAWRNKENAPMRYGLWKQELQKSAASSDGFDKAVLSWLNKK